MKKYYGLIKFVLMSLCYEMAIYLIAVKVGIDEYADRYVNGYNEDDEVDPDYMNTMEYKYEVFDSLSIRQIEKYLEIRKNASKQWWL